jgi:hypothetical protein
LVEGGGGELAGLDAPAQGRLTKEKSDNGATESISEFVSSTELGRTRFRARANVYCGLVTTLIEEMRVNG